MLIMRENNKGPEPVSTSKAYKAFYDTKLYYKRELLKLKPNKASADMQQAKIAGLQQRVDDAENEMRIMRENNKGPEPVSTSKAYKAAYERKTYYKKELLKLKPNKASADME